MKFAVELRTFLPVLAYFTLFLTISVSGDGYREYGEPCETNFSPLLTYNNNNNQRTNYNPTQPNRNEIQQDNYYAKFPPSVDGQFNSNDRVNSINDQNFNYGANERAVNESNSCRAVKGLHCDPYTRRCRCHELAGAVWDNENNRCELPLDTFCSANKGLEYIQYCTDYAECTCNWDHWDKRKWYACSNPPLISFFNSKNGKCKCKPGYRPYDDNSGCWYSTGNKIEFFTKSKTQIFTTIIVTYLTSLLLK